MSTTNDFESSVREAARKLLDDLNSKTPTVSSEIVWAYQDKNVQKSIIRRLTAGGSVESVKSLLPDIVTRYRRVSVNFSMPSVAGIIGEGILVQINESNKVAEIIDPFIFSDEKNRRLIEEREGTFLTKYSTPLMRSERGNNELTARFEKFVREEGVNVAFMRMRQSFGQPFGGAGSVFANFSSGTCVITSWWQSIPGFRGFDAPDAEEQEDDNTLL